MLTRSRLREKVRPFAKRMDAVGHENRMAIIYLLAYDPMEVREIVDNTGIAENLLAHHLKILHNTGWILKTKIGKRVTYQLNDKAFFELTRMLADTPYGRQVLSKRIR